MSPPRYETVIVPFIKVWTSQSYGKVPAFESVMVLGRSPLLKMPVLKDLSSALRLCGAPASRLVTVTLSPTFTLSLSGLNLKFWMVMVWDPAPLDEDAFLLEEPPPQAPTVRTRAAKRDSNGRGWR